MNRKISIIHGVCSKKFLEIAASALFIFNRNEQRFEITFAESFTSFALQDFVENRRAIFDGFGENLQKITFVVSVNENSELF